jgi:hypothetical protein
LELGQGHGTERLHALAVDVQRFAARGENPDVRAQSQELLDERRDGLDQVLTVVEDEQRALGPQRVDQDIERRALRSHPECSRNRLG